MDIETFLRSPDQFVDTRWRGGKNDLTIHVTQACINLKLDFGAKHIQVNYRDIDEVTLMGYIYLQQGVPVLDSCWDGEYHLIPADKEPRNE